VAEAQGHFRKQGERALSPLEAVTEATCVRVTVLSKCINELCVKLSSKFDYQSKSFLQSPQTRDDTNERFPFISLP
jgi:hypothetical protein